MAKINSSISVGRVEKTSELINDGESGVSRFVEEIELPDLIEQVLVEIGGKDVNQVFIQAIPSDTWVVANKTGKKCTPYICDTAGTQMTGRVIQNDIYQIIVQFNFPVAGEVHLN